MVPVFWVVRPVVACVCVRVLIPVDWLGTRIVDHSVSFVTVEEGDGVDDGQQSLADGRRSSPLDEAGTVADAGVAEERAVQSGVGEVRAVQLCAGEDSPF